MISSTVVRESVKAAREGVTEADWARVSSGVKEAVNDVLCGDTPGQDRENVSDAGCAQSDWKRLLRIFVCRALETDLTYNWPSRRLPHLVGLVPGRRRLPGRSRVLAALDTSGSMSAAELSEISAELERMSRSADVTVVECDAAIQTVYAYRSPVREVRGRGGTDFRPVSRRSFLQVHRPDVLVYFTDGFGPAPEKNPGVPVIWCLTEEGQRPAKWGSVVRRVN